MKPTSETPLTDALCTAIYESSAAEAAGMGREIPCEEAYGAMVEHARQLERKLMPPVVRIALLVLLNHIEPGWDNSVAVVRAWLK